MQKTIQIFISYSHEDENMTRKLQRHLALLQNRGMVETWHDRDISVGTDWAHEVHRYLERSQIILLLVSASFLASKYCYSIEMKRAMERHDAGIARVIPVILRDVDWEGAPFSKLRALPTGAKPIAGRGWHNMDEALADVTKGIRKAVEEFLNREGEILQLDQHALLAEKSIDSPSAHSLKDTISAFQTGDEQEIDSKPTENQNTFFDWLLFPTQQKIYLQPLDVTCKVEQFLYRGSQEEVYRVTIEGKPLILKWFYSGAVTDEQRGHLEMLANKKSPSEKLLWPIAVVSSATIQGFGYIEPLPLQAHYKSFIDLMKRNVEVTFRTIITVGIELALCLLDLHSNGFYYPDISFDFCVFDPTTGGIFVRNAENVFELDHSTSIIGISRFMAPELVRGEASPGINTDLHALAVLLFYLLMFHHPLEGKKEADIHIFGASAITKLYGTEPIFIFDPSDYSNRPVAGYQANALIFWPLYPQFLRDCFIQAFTQGLKYPVYGRVREDVWCTILARLRDSIYYCSQCSTENFFDSGSLRTNEEPLTCWRCKKDLLLPFRLRINDRIIVLNHDTQLFPHHIDIRNKFDFSHPIAEVTRHPTHSSVWGLKNLSDRRWVYIRPDGVFKNIDPGQSGALANGTCIYFENTVGEIWY